MSVVSKIFGGGSKPSAPDPQATAAAQMGVNKEAVLESAKHSQVGQVTPFGRTWWSGTIGEPDRTMHTAMHPMDQAILDQGRSIQGSLLNLILQGNVNAPTPSAQQTEPYKQAALAMAMATPPPPVAKEPKPQPYNTAPLPPHLMTLSMSDPRIKEDLGVVGETNNGLPVHLFRYNGEGEIRMGLMADEVEKISPECVVDLGGIKHVDYQRAVTA